MSTETESGLLHAFLLDGKGGAKSLDWAGIAAWTAADGVLWLNLDYGLPDAAAWLEQSSGIDPVYREALVDSDPRPRAVLHGEDLMMIVRGINQNQGSEPEDMISLRVWAEPQRVITMRHRVSRSLKQLASDVGKNKGPRGAADVFVQLIDRVVDHVVVRVVALGDDIAASEDQILSEKHGGDLRSQLADHRRRAIALRRFLAPQRDALAKLSTIALPWLSKSEREQIAESADRMTRSVEELDAIRDRAAVTQEEIASRMGELTNQRIYVLSIITAVFLPLGFVCSLLGVNIGGVPLRDAEWAFWGLLGLFTVGVAIQLWIFRRRGWIKRD
ncbi:MAG: zinc transporter ZntB [Deltaproteobacteria bacterium]|nr:zinc transporter ZntB [Deltaproteobacteria bacterium]